MKQGFKILLLVVLFLGSAAGVFAQVDGIGLRTQIPGWLLLSPGLGADISWNGRYMFALHGNYGDWGFSSSNTSHTIRISGAGVDVRRYFSGGEERWFNPRGGQYFGMYLGISGRLLNFDSRFTTKNKQGNIWTVGPIIGYTFHLRGNWACDTSFGVGYCYDDYTQYKWYPPMEVYRKLNEKNGGRFGITDLSVAITYRFKL